MRTLRHSGKSVNELFSVLPDGTWISPKDGCAIEDLSGGSLVQSLKGIKPFNTSDFLSVTPSTGFDSELKTELEKRILAAFSNVSGGLLWASSGSDAIEVAVSIAEMALFRKTGTKAVNYIVRRGGYHGNTLLGRFLSSRTPHNDTSLGSRSLTVLEEHQQVFKGSSYIPSAGGENATLLTALRELEMLPGPKVVIFEPVPTTGFGYWDGTDELKQAIAFCKQHNIFVILDEVACGVYRHGHFSAVSQDGNDTGPDIVVFSKGLTCGAYPLSGVSVSEKLADLILETGWKAPSFTYGLTESAAAFSIECIQSYQQLIHDGVFEQRKLLIRGFAERLNSVIDKSKIGIRITDTTLRIDFPLKIGLSINQALLSEGLWGYFGRAVFPDLEGAPSYSRAFLHLCPPFDLNQNKLHFLLNSAVKIITNSLINQELA